VLYGFSGGKRDGWLPSGVIFGSGSGDQPILYGTAWYGGAYGFGTVFSLTPPASGDGLWTETTLYSFGGVDGEYPYGGVVLGRGPGGQPVLYGTTFQGGDVGLGTVYSLTPGAPGAAWTHTVLHNFTGGSDGVNLQAGVAIGVGPGGRTVLYGSTLWGGGSANGGTVFSLTSPDLHNPTGSWTETILHSFTGPDGSYPDAGVVIASQPNGVLVLYGTTVYGGSDNYGTVFSLTPPAPGGSGWTETVLASLTGGSDGGLIYANVGVGSGREGQPVLYGVAAIGGVYPGNEGTGTVFSVSAPGAPGGEWTKTVLHSFTDSQDGGVPMSTVLVGEHGYVYGTTTNGGSNYNGTVYQLRP
jgi:uncharacterized repeat protein (TIGR03803 family)